MVKNEVGKRYGRLTVLEHAGTDGHGAALWRCRCDCGRVTTVTGAHLRTGATRSCGCLNRESTAARRRAAADPLKDTKEHIVYTNMHRRCEEPSNISYRNYGGRGIKVCARWSGADGLRNFLEDMGPRPAGCSLDRINHDGDYEPSNCRWADVETQANNKRSSVYIEFDGVRRTCAQWSRITGISPQTISKRLARGLPVEEVLYAGNLCSRRARARRELGNG